VWVGETFDPMSVVLYVCRGSRLCPRDSVHASPAAQERGIPACCTSWTLLACAVTIYLACEWFINAIEWLGVELKVGPLAVGTVLAAVGTALPESIVTLVAAVFGSPARGDDIAVGAAMGGPLVVGTIAYGVTGAMLLWRRRRLRQGAPRAGVAPNATDTEHHTSAGGQGLDRAQAWTQMVASWASIPPVWPATNAGS
jgi:hypothetical protein